MANGIRHLTFAIRHVLFAIRHLSFAIRHVSFAIRHVSFAIQHVSSAICHPPSAIRHSQPSVRVRSALKPIPTPSSVTNRQGRSGRGVPFALIVPGKLISRDGLTVAASMTTRESL